MIHCCMRSDSKRAVFFRRNVRGTGKQLEAKPRHSLWRLSQETDVSKSSVPGATKLLLLKPYKFTGVRKSGGRPCGEGTTLLLILLGKYSGEVHGLLIHETRFYLNGQVNTQNSLSQVETCCSYRRITLLSKYSCVLADIINWEQVLLYTVE